MAEEVVKEGLSIQEAKTHGNTFVKYLDKVLASEVHSLQWNPCRDVLACVGWNTTLLHTSSSFFAALNDSRAHFFFFC